MKLDDLTNRSNNINFSEWRYYIVYYNNVSNPTEESENNWINKRLKYIPHKISRVKDNYYKVEANNKSRLLRILPNLSYIDENILPKVKSSTKIYFKKSDSEFDVDYIKNHCPYNKNRLIIVDNETILFNIDGLTDLEKIKTKNWIKYFDYAEEN